MSKEMLEKGLQNRTEVLGEKYVTTSFHGADDFNRDFQEFMTAYCWGECWSRDGLERKQRSLLNLGMLAALGKGEEFETHFRAAFGNGMTLAEMKDVMIQIAVYCGVPAGVDAQRRATKVLKQMQEDGIDVA